MEVILISSNNAFLHPKPLVEKEPNTALVYKENFNF